MEFEVLHNSNAIGVVRISIHSWNNPQCWLFRQEGSVPFYLSQIPFRPEGNFVILDLIEIRSALRKRGLGTLAMKGLIPFLGSFGAKVAFLRGGNSPLTQEKLVEWYSGLGWNLLQTYQVPGQQWPCTVDIMWRSLADLPPPVDEIRFSAVSEVSIFGKLSHGVERATTSSSEASS